MIGELIHAVTTINRDPHQQLIILRGKGKSFSAGADLEMMKDIVNTDDGRTSGISNQLPDCLEILYHSTKPVIGVAHGSVHGGANGILAVTDVALADINTWFSFSEVKMGLIPAVISPYVIKRIGEFNAKDFMLTGRRLTAGEAESTGLINKALAPQELESYLNELITEIGKGSPPAVKRCKSLIDHVVNRWTFREALRETDKWIREIRATEDAQKRIKSFLNKKKK
jgi:methylglutaconyl-CoA hydratase